MSYWIIAVGSELTTGMIADTNSQHISKRLGKEGFICSRQVSVPDDMDAIAEALNEALASSDGAIVTGGLGPTADDVTREAVSKAFNLKLILSDHLKSAVAAWYAHGDEIPDRVYKQAYIPEGSIEIPATTGSAAGFYLETRSKPVVVLPGVPSEMKDMLEWTLPMLKEKWKSGPVRVLKVLKTTGRSEAQLEGLLGDLLERKDIEIGIMASPGEIELQLRALSDTADKARKLIDRAEREIEKRLGRLVYGTGDKTLQEAVVELLIELGKTVATAESCTGGLISKMLTDVPGSSACFKGGAIAYSNESKVKSLGVPAEVLERYGAVSAECAAAMARGARECLDADIGVSITCIAGPEGGTAEKLVGLTYISLSAADREDAWEFSLNGCRRIVRERGAKIALDELRKYLLDLTGKESPCRGFSSESSFPKK